MPDNENGGRAPGFYPDVGWVTGPGTPAPSGTVWGTPPTSPTPSGVWPTDPGAYNPATGLPYAWGGTPGGTPATGGWLVYPNMPGQPRGGPVGQPGWPGVPFPQPGPRPAGAGKFNIPFPEWNWTPTGPKPRTAPAGWRLPEVPAGQPRTTTRTTRRPAQRVKIGERWEEGEPTTITDPKTGETYTIPGEGRFMDVWGWEGGEPGFGGMGGPEAPGEVVTTVTDVEDIDPLERFRVLQDVATRAQNQQQAADELALAYERLGLDAAKADLAAQQDAANFQLTLAQAEQKAYEAEQERGFQRWQTETTLASQAQRQQEQLAAQQAQFQQQLAFDREKLTAELGIATANRNIQILSLVLPRFFSMSLAEQSAARDMLRYLGLDLDQYLALMPGGQVAQPAMPRWR